MENVPLLEQKEAEPLVDLFRAVHYVHLKPDELAILKEDSI
jgi:hypothetical protein